MKRRLNWSLAFGTLPAVVCFWGRHGYIYIGQCCSKAEQYIPNSVKYSFNLLHVTSAVVFYVYVVSM